MLELLSRLLALRCHCLAQFFLTPAALALQPAGHAPLLGQLAEPSQVRVKLAGGEEVAYDVSGGFLSVSEAGVTVLAEDCSPATPQTAAH